MSLPKIVNDLAAKLVDLPAILSHVIRLVAQLETLTEQQDRIEAKLDSLLAALPEPAATPKAKESKEPKK